MALETCEERAPEGADEIEGEFLLVEFENLKRLLDRDSSAAAGSCAVVVDAGAEGAGGGAATEAGEATIGEAVST